MNSYLSQFFHYLINNADYNSKARLIKFDLILIAADSDPEVFGVGPASLE